MEQKLVRVPFNMETAKRIQNKECAGKIITRVGGEVRNVVFDLKNEECPICAIVETNVQKEDVMLYLKDGSFRKGCTDDLDLMLEIPEYMTFKDGDIIACGNENCSWISIIKSLKSCEDGIVTTDYVTLVTKGIADSDRLLSFEMFTNAGKWARLATEAERQTMINALKGSKESKAKEYLKRFFNIEVKSKCDFKVGQPVIGIDGRGEWRYDLFSHYKPEYRNGNYVCSARSYSTCLPYNEKTAHLIGTTGDWEE